MRQAALEKRDYTDSEREIIEQARAAQAKVVAVDEFEMDAKTLARPALER